MNLLVKPNLLLVHVGILQRLIVGGKVGVRKLGLRT